MNADDLYKSFESVDDETLLKSETKKRSRMSAVKWLSAAAAVLVIAVSIFAIMRIVKDPNNGSHSVDVPTASPTEHVTPVPTVNATAAPVDPTQPSQAKTCSIFEVTNPQLAVSHFDHKNEISNTTILSVDATKLNITKTVEFLGEQYDVIYKQTIYYLLGDTTVDQFSVVDNNADSLLFLPDGTVYAALISPVTTIDIDMHADKETVRAAVEAALFGEIDFTGFEFCDIEGSLEDTTGGFGLYTLRWYNKKHDIMTGEIVQVSVRQNGEVGSVWMKNRVDLGLDELPDDFNINDYTSDIENKLHEIYGDALIDYEVMWEVLTRYDASPCIDITIGVSCIDPTGELMSEACELAVVIDL